MGKPADMDDRLRYWLSDQGMAEFEQKLDAHFAAFLKEHEHVLLPFGTSSQIPSQLVVIKEYPARGRQTLMTMGLSGFILDDPEAIGYCRQEFAISTIDEQFDYVAAPMLAAVAGFALAQARYLPELTAIAHEIVPRELRFDRFAVVVPFLGIWLPPEITYINSEFQGYVSELALLSSAEYQLLTQDFDAFTRQTEDSSVDYTDFRRSLAP